MPLQSWLAFAFLVTVLSATPGPAVLLVLSQSLSRGMAMAFWAILGIVVVNFLYFAISGTGLSALLLASPKLYAVLKWIGAGYLLVIGVGEFFSKSTSPYMAGSGAANGRGGMFAKGFVLQISSPAALLFFVAVIPQFLDLKQAVTPQIIALAVTGNAAELIVLGCYAALADRFNAIVMKGRYPRVLARISGVLLVAAAITMAAFNA
jgi:threonine/homoserine/homoserine lactone efflux protein